MTNVNVLDFNESKDSTPLLFMALGFVFLRKMDHGHKLYTSMT